MKQTEEHHEAWRIWPDGESERISPTKVTKDQAVNMAQAYSDARLNANERWLAMAVRVHGGEPRYAVVKVTTRYEEVE